MLTALRTGLLRHWSRLRGWFGALSLPVIVVVTVVMRTGMPVAHKGLKHFSTRAGCVMHKHGRP